MHAEGYPAAEMKHGPIALIDDDMPVVVLATAGPAYEALGNIEEVRARGGHVYAIVSEGDTHAASLAEVAITVPAAPRSSPRSSQSSRSSSSPTTSPI